MLTRSTFRSWAVRDSRTDGRGLWEQLRAARRRARAFFGREPDAGDPDPPKAPNHVWEPRALVIVASTIAVDLAMVVLSYAIARAVWPALRSPDFRELARVSPVILATIPCWLIVFQSFGLYSPKQVLRPSLPIVRLLEAISLSIFALIVVAFATNDGNLHRAWVVTLWIVAMILIVSGRLMMQRVVQLLNQDHGLGPPAS